METKVIWELDIAKLGVGWSCRSDRRYQSNQRYRRAHSNRSYQSNQSYRSNRRAQSGRTTTDAQSERPYKGLHVSNF
ncbi:hypothetical protein [uncultured Porphyromonas sp.]|uniref:hypothetical protein n=1 Tax=uncultured Porphyromonas sp. TaxID=159274 RepID=UPI002804A141|nr:hypothetical protein [uncultured Porphyromonas sp.]